ncbi:MAG: hypothetical protein OEY88_00230 [Candidatus Bathyarchaeota archaeon]|nr:hypothetical protein [Candidatus Bathyarchaeota archaeon]
MRKYFSIIVRVFALANIVLAIAIAYVYGEMRGISSQEPIIKELMEEISGLHVDFGLFYHPLWHPLLGLAFIFGFCWIMIAIVYLENRKK